MYIKLLFSSCVFVSLFSYGQTEPFRDIPALIKKKGLVTSHLGLVIAKKTAKKTKIIYQLNGNKLFIPASLTKMVSLSAFYHYYPVHFKFQTELLSSAPIQDGVLKGDLFFRAGGDPSFTSESLWNLINNFVRTGIKKIEGDLIIDDKIYKKTYYLPYTDRSYAAPVNAASFNWNSVSFWIRPGKKGGDLARIYVNPENTFIKVVNQVKTVSRGRTSIKLRRSKHSSRGETFVLKGQISIRRKEAVKYGNIQNPNFWLASNVRSFLKQRDILISGHIKKGRCKSCRTLARFKSRPFPFHAYNMMKYSNNFVSRMLTTHLPLIQGKKQGNLNQGIQMINAYLKKQVGLRGYKMIEPSGLSRKNRFSPKHFQKLLNKDQSHFHNSEIFISYPLGGGVGTLEDRFNSAPFYVRAKTGSILGVQGLSGYAGRSNDEKFVFTFLYNGSIQNISKVKELFDEIILYLFK